MKQPEAENECAVFFISVLTKLWEHADMQQRRPTPIGAILPPAD